MGAAILCFTMALGQMDVHEAVPFQKLVLVFTLLYGIIIEKSGFAVIVLIGMALIVAGVVLLSIECSNKSGLLMALLFIILATMVQILDKLFPTTVDAGMVYPIRITIA